MAQRHLLLEATHQATVSHLCLAHHTPALDGLGRVVPIPLLGGDEHHALHHDDMTFVLPISPTGKGTGSSAPMRVSALAAVLDEAVKENEDK